MRKLYFSLFIALSLIMTACVAGLDDELNHAEISINRFADLTAEFEGDTRTYIEEDKSLRWHEGDLLSVFYGLTLNSQYRFNGQTGDNGGTFSVVPDDDLATGNSLNAIYALYPYSDKVKISEEGIISCTLPSVQSYAEKSFGRGANTMVAVTENTDDTALKFKNVCGYLKIRLYGNAVVNSIVLSGNNGEKIAGEATISAVYGGEPTVEMSDKATEAITLDCDKGVTLGNTEEEATDFWFVVPATTFEKGITIVATDNKGAMSTTSTTKSISVERNTIQPMEAVEFIGTDIVKPANNQIFYTSTDDVIIEPYAGNVFGANIISNIYENGQGIITFDGDVTQIGEQAFYANSSTSDGRRLTTITIPNSVTSIGNEAFRSCTSLTSVTIPNSVTSIGEGAFCRCASLEKFYGKFASADNCYLIVNGVLNSFAISCDLAEFTIPNSVTEIGYSAFDGCKSLTSVTIPDSVTEIGKWAFGGCTSLKSITIPNSVTKIGHNAFSSCSSLTSITIPDSITSIADAAFGSCTSLTSITIPDSVTSIEGRAFTYCTSLTSITIPDSVTSIGNFAFRNCSSLTSVTIPDSVTSIGEWAFYDCTSLTEVYCKPTTPPTGGSNMFYNNASSRKIYVPLASVEAYKAAEYWSNYADYIFPDITEPTNNKIYYTSSDGAIIKPYATDVFGANIVSNTYKNGIGVIEFDGNVTQIGLRAFYASNEKADASRLTSITIPNSVTSIGNYAFHKCTSLASITIPDGVTSIGSYALASCSSLANVTIGESVTSIGNYAFGECSLLTTITIPDSVTEIGINPFIYCSSLSAFYGKFASADNRCLIANGVLKSFARSGLTQYTISDRITEIGNYVFSQCSTLTNISIPNSVTTIGAYAFSQCSVLTNINIPNGVTSIGNYAFCECSVLTNIDIPNGVTSIGNYAFYQCSALANIDIPNSVVSIGAAAFWACKSFTSVTIPDSVTELGSHAFACCAKLEYFYGKFASSDNRSLIIGSTLNSYAAGAAIESYTIPKDVTKIDSNAFQNSDYLTKITIPECVTEIGLRAFYSCNRLVSIYCKPTTPPTIDTNVFDSNASGRKIYVPSTSVSLYKGSQNWNNYADVIYSESGDDASSDLVATPEDKYPSKTNFKRRVLITQFTGTACGFCPRIVNALHELNNSSYADDVVLTAAHLFNSNDPAYLSSATDLDSSLGISSFPNVCVDLNKSALTSSSYSSIVSLINKAQSRVAVKGGIAVNSKYNAENGSISINALVKAKESAEFRIGAWLLEDGVYGVQTNNGYTPLDGVDFNTHNNCIRTAFSNATSSDFTGYSLGTIEAGKSASREFTFSLKSNGTGSQTQWNHDNLRLVVFISTKEGDNWYVNNVIKCPKDGSVDFEYLD